MQTYSLSCSLFSIKKTFPLLNLRKFLLFEFFLIVFLLLSILFQTNIITSLEYQIQDFQKKDYEISRKNKSLEIDFAKKNDLRIIEEKIQQLSFEKANKIHYIEIIDGSVVLK